MPNQIAKITEGAKAVLRVVKSVGSLIISQSESASESFASHQLRLAKVEAAREFMVNEARSLAETRRTLRESYYDASNEERVRLRRDIEECERELRRLEVISKAVEKLSTTTEQEAEEDENLESTEMSPHWLDKFNEFAKARNEPWREELLASALALEAKEPGAIGPRALWVIGTLDEDLFHAFASILDVSCVVAGGYVVPEHTKFIDRPVPECALGANKTIGNLIFMLSDIGLFGDVLTSRKRIPENARLLAQYGHRSALIETKKAIQLGGVIPTSLGQSIARLYTPQPNLLGQEIFEKWLNGIPDDTAEHRDLS